MTNAVDRAGTAPFGHGSAGPPADGLWCKLKPTVRSCVCLWLVEASCGHRNGPSSPVKATIASKVRGWLPAKEQQKTRQLRSAWSLRKHWGETGGVPQRPQMGKFE